MADSSRTDGSRARTAAGDADRDEKIEQLLLAGLDHYFAARYEHAINVWTRALFLDRSHPRAHAYIERARSALAERQRRSEELLQDGVSALNRGHGYEARRLLRAAVEHGAHAVDTHPLLERLNREAVELADAVAPPRVRPGTRLKAALKSGQQPEARPIPSRSRRASWLLPTSVALVALLAYAALKRDDLGRWLFFSKREMPIASAALPGVGQTILPQPRRGEMALDRARGLALRGRLHEALSVLQLVHATDPEKLDADRMRIDLQRQLLGLGPASPPPAPPVLPARDKSDRAGGDPR